nr:hypothetical protein [Oscillospiraceae bacterium]
MYKIAKMTFKPLIEESRREIAEKIDGFLYMLYMNGQIIKEWIVEMRNDHYIATTITTDDDSLDSKYYNSHIRKELANFEVSYEIICDEFRSTDCCHCSEHSYYILAVNPNDNSSPIICGDCGKEIPLIRIPYLYQEEEHFSILGFQSMYKAVDRLWMEGLSDRFTKRQIINHKSQLNKVGMDICTELEKKAGNPVYYLLGNPIGGWYEFEKNNKILTSCPKCGGEIKTCGGHCDDDFNLCHECRLAFITHEMINKVNDTE